MPDNLCAPLSRYAGFKHIHLYRGGWSGSNVYHVVLIILWCQWLKRKCRNLHICQNLLCCTKRRSWASHFINVCPFLSRVQNLCEFWTQKQTQYTCIEFTRFIYKNVNSNWGRLSSEKRLNTGNTRRGMERGTLLQRRESLLGREWDRLVLEEVAVSVLWGMSMVRGMVWFQEVQRGNPGESRRAGGQARERGAYETNVKHKTDEHES